MVLRRIVIDNFKGVNHFEANLNRDFNVIFSDHATDIMLAVTGMLHYPTDVIGNISDGIKKDTNIALYTEEPGDIDRLGTMNISGVSRESLGCCVFYNYKKQGFSKKLHEYRQSEDYFGKKEFNAITAGFGNTAVFDSYLREYLKKNIRCMIGSKKNIEVKLCRDGEFRASSGVSNLSPEERMLIELYSFGRLHYFWEESAKLMTLEPPDMPVLLGGDINLFRSDMPYDKENAIKKALDTSSQIIVFSDDLS